MFFEKNNFVILIKDLAISGLFLPKLSIIGFYE